MLGQLRVYRPDFYRNKSWTSPDIIIIIPVEATFCYYRKLNPGFQNYVSAKLSYHQNSLLKFHIPHK